MTNLSPDTIISRIITLMIAFTVHEFSHAWVANAFGDDTPRANGRLSLNPAVHLDLLGTLMLLFAGFGWAKPVPVNPYALKRRSPAALMLVSLAGPLSNFVLAVLAAIPLRFGLIPAVYNWPGFLPTPYSFLLNFMVINILLMLFNLIPLSPLDGEKVLEYFLPPAGVDFLDRIRPYSPLILLGIVFILPILGFDLFGMILNPLLRAISSLLLGVSL
ncbi:MAG: site-2 protease family protein [Chloroflexi bacterium]|nr:site-2 protease family protein [Chloroflexota bacterium]